MILRDLNHEIDINVSIFDWIIFEIDILFSDHLFNVQIHASHQTYNYTNIARD